MLRLACIGLLLIGTACGPAGGRASATYIVTGGIVVTMDAEGRILSPGAVAIDGATIVAVDRPDVVASRYAAADTIDATGRVVMPGLINAHTHAPMVLYRGLADDLALDEWLTRYIFPAEAHTVTPEFVRVGTRLAALEMIASGTTTFADMYYFEEAIADEVRRAGLRAVLGQTIIQFPVPDARTPADGLARAEAFVRAWRGDALVTPAVAPHALYTLDPEALRRSRALADRYGVPLLIHVAETRDERARVERDYGASPVAYLDGLGLWAPRTVAAHAVWVSDEDIATLARRGVGVVHNPESNMKLASGAAPVTRLRAAGIATGLGTDGAASNNDLDMFEAMRQAALLQKLVTGDPMALGAADVLAMATREGARALGLADRLGSLEPGKRADLIVVAMDAARQVPMYDPVSHLVYVTRGDDVRTVMVEGRILMRERRILTLQADRVMGDARAMAERVRAAVRRSGPRE